MRRIGDPYVVRTPHVVPTFPELTALEDRTRKRRQQMVALGKSSLDRPTKFTRIDEIREEAAQDMQQTWTGEFFAQHAQEGAFQYDPNFEF